MRRINGIDVFMAGPSLLPGGLKERAGFLRLARRIEDATPLQQIAHPGTAEIVGQEGLHCIERLMGGGKVALQALGAGNLGQ